MIKKFLIAFVVVAFAATTQAIQLKQVEAGTTNTTPVTTPVVADATTATPVVEAEATSDVEKSSKSKDKDDEVVEWEGSAVLEEEEE